MSKNKKNKAEKREEILNAIEEQGWKDSPDFSVICEKYGWKKDFGFFHSNIQVNACANKASCAKMYYSHDRLFVACDVVCINDVPFEKIPEEEQIRIARLMTLSPQTDKDKDREQGFGIARIRKQLSNTRLAGYINTEAISARIEKDGRCNLYMCLKSGDTIMCPVQLVSMKAENEISFDDIAEKAIDTIAEKIRCILVSNKKNQSKWLRDAVENAIRNVQPNAENIRFERSAFVTLVSFELPDKERPGLTNRYAKTILESAVKDIVKKTPDFESKIVEMITAKKGWHLKETEIEEELKNEIIKKVLEAINQDAEAVSAPSQFIIRMLQSGTLFLGCEGRFGGYLKLILNGGYPESISSGILEKELQISLSNEGFAASFLEITANYSYKTKDIIINKSPRAEGIVSLLSKSKNVFFDVKDVLKENINLFSAFAADAGLNITSQEDEYCGNEKAGVSNQTTLKYDCSNIADVEKWIIERVKQHEEALKKRKETIRNMGKESALYPEIIKIVSHCNYGASMSKITSILRSPSADTSFMSINYVPGKFKSFSKAAIEDAVRKLVFYDILLEKENYWRRIGGYYTSYEIKDKDLAALASQDTASCDKEQDISLWKSNNWERMLLSSPEKLNKMKMEDLQLLFGFPAVCERYAGTIAEKICKREDKQAITDFIEIAAQYSNNDKKTAFAALRKAVRKENKRLEAAN